MIYRRGQKVLVQGITGKQGSFWAERMMETGTTIAAGVNPKRAGERHLGLPIYASAKDATRAERCDLCSPQCAVRKVLHGQGVSRRVRQGRI